jgi:protease-4
LENLDENGNIISDETASESVVYAIEEAEKDENIKAIILEVDSYGGSAVAAEEIAQAMKRAIKPTVALVRTAATSAAYWASTGAKTIFASNLSDIGSIGVTMSYLDNSKKNIKDGLTYNSLSTGKFKDYGDSDKPLTAEERKLLMRDLNIMNENFIQVVATNRNLDINKVQALADGSSMPGQMAKDNGFIDRIGGMPEVKEYLKEKIGEDVEVCW